MAEALDSDKIARHAFEVGRRGYEQQEVRAFLHEVSSLVQRLEREIAEQRERAAHAEVQLDQAGAPDEAMLLERLGEETTRVLSSAREAAAEIRAKAEVEAERIVAHATLDAAEARAEAMRGADRRVVEAEAERESLLHDARTELDRRRAEAEEVARRIRDEAAAEVEAIHEGAQEEAARLRAEAEEALEAARAQGRDMVAEAQAVRERVLHDLAVRRKKARRQVEKLNAGRERLLQAYDVVRRLIDEATDELGVSLIDARAAADAAGQRVEGEPDPSPEQLAAEMSAALLDVDVDDDHEGEAEDEDDAGHDELDEDGGPLLIQSAAVSDPGRSPGGVASQPSSGVTGPAPSVESRRRKGRRRKGGFVGLPEAGRAPAGEGVTLLPATPGAEPHTDDRAPGPRGSDGTEVGPDRSAGDEAADIEADLQRAQERVREAELAAERQRAADAAREVERQRAAEAERAEAEARAAQAKEESERAEAQRADAERAAAERAAVRTGSAARPSAR
jgi:cell division septum initiation protein DivIVA